MVLNIFTPELDPYITVYWSVRISFSSWRKTFEGKMDLPNRSGKNKNTIEINSERLNHYFVLFLIQGTVK